MIEVENLSKRYGTKLAVDGLSFVVQPGMITGFLGPNGAGKSTTMRMIAGLDKPTSGRVIVNGGDYRSAAAPMAELGVLLEAKAVHTGRSARNHLLALAQSNGISRKRVDQVIDIVGLQQVAGTRVGGFSLGMGQRLGVASALLGNPADGRARRTCQRTGPRRRALDAHHAQGPGRRRAHRLRVLPSHERNGPNRNPSGCRRPRPADRRHHRHGVHRPGVASRRHRPHSRDRPLAGAAASPGHHRHRRPTGRAGDRRTDRRTHRHHRLAAPDPHLRTDRPTGLPGRSIHDPDQRLRRIPFHRHCRHRNNNHPAVAA